MKVLLNWLLAALAILAVAYLLPSVTVSSFLTALAVALVLGLINTFIRPLVLLLTLPINILTLGLFTLVVNTLMVLLAAEIVPGFAVGGFWSAFVFSVVLWAVNSLFRVVGAAPVSS